MKKLFLLHTELFLTKEKLSKEMGFRFHISHIQIIFSNINNFEMGVCKKKKKNVFILDPQKLKVPQSGELFFSETNFLRVNMKHYRVRK